MPYLSSGLANYNLSIIKNGGEHPRPRWTRVLRPAPNNAEALLFSDYNVTEIGVFVNLDERSRSILRFFRKFNFSHRIPGS